MTSGNKGDVRLSVGDTITITAWLAPDEDGGVDEAWVGHPLEVVLVEEPFVVVKYLLHPEQPATPLDLRRVTLMRVSEAYVKALRPAPAIGPSMDDLMRAIDRLKDAVVAAAELDAD